MLALFSNNTLNCSTKSILFSSHAFNNISYALFHELTSGRAEAFTLDLYTSSISDTSNNAGVFVRSIIFHFKVLKINYGALAGRGQLRTGGNGINEGFAGGVVFMP